MKGVHQAHTMCDTEYEQGKHHTNWSQIRSLDLSLKAFETLADAQPFQMTAFLNWGDMIHSLSKPSEGQQAVADMDRWETPAL